MDFILNRIAFALIMMFRFKHVDAETCPDAWISHGESCYFFGRSKFSMPEAWFFCEKFGGRLVEINTDDQFEWIRSQISRLDGYFWIGATDELEEGHFIWASSRNDVTLSFWGQNQPNDNDGDKNCVWITKDGYWRDMPCYHQVQFICEM